MPKLHVLVKSLESESANEIAVGTAYLLVAESATNIFQSFIKVSEAADKYHDALRER